MRFLIPKVLRSCVFSAVFAKHLIPQYMFFNSGMNPFQLEGIPSRLEWIHSRPEWIPSGDVPEFGYENSPQNSGIKVAI